MKFAIATKHMHLVVTYREPEEDEEIEEQYVSNLDGDFDIAPPLTADVQPEEDKMHFGFARG